MRDYLAFWTRNTKFSFGSVIAVVFKSVFHLKIHQNDVFLFKKNYF